MTFIAFALAVSFGAACADFKRYADDDNGGGALYAAGVGVIQLIAIGMLFQKVAG
ncbi:hypothetical protein CcrC1_gp482 [Caulobacter phage C1]|nr:hypothetical protein CcrC1_gp482 [Caulobacter phage C1]UTU08695.1 hypothetical protein CcrC2_gp468 [Caulobacter phage C2]UTU09227.1 hypothetical protein CcrJ4_gp480 [Caulobacter phage J4]WGN97357.1 hypothetical protein [Bertelyvirus sp.]WGN97895.1 hypothetical protein [Bertelyvirus sp.]